MRRRKAPEPLPPAASICPRKKRRKLAELEPPRVDRISALPDELLGEIILLLPMKDGARTQALASRWRRLWRSVPLNLDFCELVADEFPYTVSSKLVSRIRSTHLGPVRRLCSRVRRSAGIVDDAWLHSADLDNLEELEFVSLVQKPPASIFRFSATLRVASVADCELPDGAVQGLRFPRLKQLGLEHVHVSERSLHGLIAGCPALEFLMVHRCSGFRLLRINSLTLRSVSVPIDEPKKWDPKLQFGRLIIEKAPSLERLIHLYIYWDMQASVLSTPKFETLGFLYDWKDICKKLVCAKISKLRVDSPTAAVSTVKSLAVNMKILSLDGIVDLMRLFPCLVKLHVKSGVSGEANWWRRKHGSFIKCHDIRLKTLVLESYRGSLSHVNFSTFFILNARVLQNMEFQVEAKLFNNEFLAEQHTKLQLDNKASRGATFQFTTASCQHVVWSTKHLRDFDIKDPFRCGC